MSQKLTSTMEVDSMSDHIKKNHLKMQMTDMILKNSFWKIAFFYRT